MNVNDSQRISRADLAEAWYFVRELNIALTSHRFFADDHELNGGTYKPSKVLARPLADARECLDGLLSYPWSDLDSPERHVINRLTLAIDTARAILEGDPR